MIGKRTKKRVASPDESAAGPSSSHTNEGDKRVWKRLRGNRYKPEYLYAQNNATKKFFEWFEQNQNKYKHHRLFKKDRNGRWVMGKKEAKYWVKHIGKYSHEGNCLFEYVVHSRKGFHARLKQGMSHFRDTRAAILNLLKQNKVHYDFDADQNLEDFWKCLNNENEKWCLENGIDDLGRRSSTEGESTEIHDGKTGQAGSRF